MNMFDLHRIDQHIVDSFEADWFVFANLRDVIACVVNVGITQHQQRARWWVYNQLQRRFENESAGAFRSHQRTGDIESVFGKQIVEIATGNPTWNFRVTLPNEFPILIT